MSKGIGNIIDLSWVDEFILRVRPYIFVRIEDNLLIKRPNMAQKLNSTGAVILKQLTDGKPMNQLLDEIGRGDDKIRDISNFMVAIKHQLEGTLDEFTQNPAVESAPFSMPFSKYPVLSEIALTYRCNLKCIFCYAGCGCKSHPIRSGQEMSTPQVKRILQKICHQAKVPSVSFTGGEPALVKDLPILVGYAKDLGMRVNLITNGTQITQQLSRELAHSGLDSAQVSIEGAAAQTHDAVVGQDGAFEKSVRAVFNLKEAGILTHTNTTITKLNMHECIQFPDFVKDTLGNDRFSMNLVIPAGTGAANPDILLPYSGAGQVIRAVMGGSRRREVDFMWYSPVPLCMFNSVAHGLGNKGCSACDGLISIAANGDVLPCASCDDSVGNLLTDDFDAIWRSDKARQYREKQFAHPACKSCENFHICNGACLLYWRKMGFSELLSGEDMPDNN